MSDAFILVVEDDPSIQLGLRMSLEREGYTFPTLLGDDYFQRLLPTTELSVPQTWLVDGEHVLRQRQRGFEMGSAEGLENEIVERLQAMVAED